MKRSALKHEASARQQELAQPKEKRNADAEPMPWQISQDYKGPQVHNAYKNISCRGNDSG